MARIILVEWEDSAHYGTKGWIDKDDAEAYAKKPPIRCQSVGFLIGDKKHSVTLAESIAPSQAGEVINIPKTAIRWRIDITPDQKHKKRKRKQ